MQSKASKADHLMDLISGQSSKPAKKESAGSKPVEGKAAPGKPGKK